MNWLGTEFRSITVQVETRQDVIRDRRELVVLLYVWRGGGITLANSRDNQQLIS
jgi:hypothetical protein